MGGPEPNDPGRIKLVRSSRSTWPPPAVHAPADGDDEDPQGQPVAVLEAHLGPQDVETEHLQSQEEQNESHYPEHDVAISVAGWARGVPGLSPLQFHTPKMTLLTLVAGVISLPGILAILLIDPAIRASSALSALPMLRSCQRMNCISWN